MYLVMIEINGMVASLQNLFICLIYIDDVYVLVDVAYDIEESPCIHLACFVFELLQ
jgi:hypothetical protein